MMEESLNILTVDTYMMLKSKASIAKEYGRFIKSRLEGNVIEVVGQRKRGIVRRIVAEFGSDSLVVVTMNGYERVVSEIAGSEVYVVSEEYFKKRARIKDVSEMRKLVKTIVEELYSEMRKNDYDSALIYRANDLPPVILGFDQNFVEEEFWRMLTMDIRALGIRVLFAYERTDYKPDVLSLFADTVVELEDFSVWSVFG